MRRSKFTAHEGASRGRTSLFRFFGKANESEGFGLTSPKAEKGNFKISETDEYEQIDCPDGQIQFARIYKREYLIKIEPCL
jgi:hypothetical protein